MKRDERFTFLINTEERKLIRELAKRLQRSESDAIRYIVVNAARELRVMNGERDLSTGSSRANHFEDDRQPSC